MKKYLFIALGALMFGLGTLGIFVPFLPTTVFYLLTAFFWLRSSEKLYRRFMGSEKYQRYVQEPLINKKISNGGMVRMFVMMAIVFAIPGLLVDNTPMRICLVVVYLAHLLGLTWYLRVKKARKQKLTNSIEETRN